MVPDEVLVKGLHTLLKFVEDNPGTQLMEIGRAGLGDPSADKSKSYGWAYYRCRRCERDGLVYSMVSYLEVEDKGRAGATRSRSMPRRQYYLTRVGQQRLNDFEAVVED